MNNAEKRGMKKDPLEKAKDVRNLINSSEFNMNILENLVDYC